MTAANVATLNHTGPVAIGHRQVLVAFSGLVLAMLLAALDSTIVSTALQLSVPRRRSSLCGSNKKLHWIILISRNGMDFHRNSSRRRNESSMMAT